MARLIQKSGYIQGGRAARYMEYVAKRDGVEVIQSTEPVTKKQMQFLTKLLKDFPDAKELFEYADYLQTPNRGTASAFIAAALDTHLHELESESGYMAYIANRPGWKSTAVTGYSVRRMLRISRPQRMNWRLTPEKCGPSFSPCGGRMRSAWDTAKQPHGRTY